MISDIINLWLLDNCQKSFKNFKIESSVPKSGDPKNRHIGFQVKRGVIGIVILK